MERFFEKQNFRGHDKLCFAIFTKKNKVSSLINAQWGWSKTKKVCFRRILRKTNFSGKNLTNK